MEFAQWAVDQNYVQDLDYPRQSAFSQVPTGFHSDTPETENVKIVRDALNSHPLMGLVAECAYIHCRRKSFVKKALWLKEKGVDMGDKPSMQQFNQKALESQLLAFIQGVITCVDNNEFHKG